MKYPIEIRGAFTIKLQDGDTLTIMREDRNSFDVSDGAVYTKAEKVFVKA